MLTYAYNLPHWQDNGPTPFERLLRRDRVIVGIALLILILLAWFYVRRLATSTDIIGAQIVATFRPWSGAKFIFTFLMWAAMMVAMMLPSATPMVLRYARIGRATAF